MNFNKPLWRQNTNSYKRNEKKTLDSSCHSNLNFHVIRSDRFTSIRYIKKELLHLSNFQSTLLRLRGQFGDQDDKWSNNFVSTTIDSTK